MITITPIDGGCHIDGATASFDIFPTKRRADAWALQSHPEESLDDGRVISWPGEYDFQGVTLRSVGQEQGKQVSHAALVDGVRMAFVDTPVLDWSDADVERLGAVDVLVIAADQPKKVMALVEAVDPRIVVLRSVKGGDLAGSAKACGLASPTAVAELKIKAGALPQDSRQVVVLE